MSERPRSILHVDMDAFFAAIEQLDRPELLGKPILVGSDRPRGVVATASYEARVFGCRSALPMAVALRLCPHAIVVPVRGRRYREVSERLFTILHDFTPSVEPLSIDEAFLDVTGTERLHGGAEQVARRLKQRIREELNLTASVGVAPNKFLAKLASDLRKPDGVAIIMPENLDEILLPLPVSKLWGVGPKTAERLIGYGIHTFADVRQASIEKLTRLCGIDGEHYRNLAFGIDARPVTPDGQARSISQEETFEQDETDPQRVRETILDQAEQVARRLRRSGLLARAVTLKIRYGEFKTITRTRALPRATDVTAELWESARQTFDDWAQSGFQPIRLIGTAATRLAAGGEQLGLFDQSHRDRHKRLDATVDRINERFGKRSIHRGR